MGFTGKKDYHVTLRHYGKHSNPLNTLQTGSLMYTLCACDQREDFYFVSDKQTILGQPRLVK